MLNVRRALVSVSDKRGLIPFAAGLKALGIEILSTGGTCRELEKAGIAAIEVSHRTGFPEMMGGRIKTLHPVIHGGLLGRRGTDEDVMEAHGIDPIDLLVVNLYPFEQTVSDPQVSIADAIEQIDIGGPAMVRAAAKNHESVVVVVSPDDYDYVLESLSGSEMALADRRRLAAKAYTHTAGYDAAISRYLYGTFDEPPDQDRFIYSGNRLSRLRYGENPHQQAEFFRDPAPPAATLAGASQLQGKELSYNNIADGDAALECVKQFDLPACVIVKHANPCGVAIDESPIAAYERAYTTDPTSAFGGIIAFNRTFDADTARAIIDRQFVEVIIAPEIADEARPVLAEKKNVRVLRVGEWSSSPGDDFEMKKVSGGLLVQTRDKGMITRGDLEVVTEKTPDPGQFDDLLFAWKVAKFVKSNAIVFCRNGMTIGIGAGQMSRVYSTRIAAIKASDEGLDVAGSVMASDAFFPFRDGIDRAAETGVSAIIQPGGSMRDNEVIEAANEHGLAMVFTGMRHFRH